MIYLIRFLIAASIVSFSLQSCIEQIFVEEYNELCPYERRYGGRDFYLEVPLYVEPLQLTYQVGDTMNIRMELTDEVRDLSRDAVFKIENFPFKPSHELYRIDDNSWETGYNGNELYVDSIYNPSLIQESSGWSVNVRGVPTYEAGVYFMEHQLVLREPGRYVHLVRDVIEAIDGHLIAEGRIPEYAAVSNDSGCPTPHTYDAVSYTHLTLPSILRV